MFLKIIAAILAIPLGELTKRNKVYQLKQERQKAKKLQQWLAGVAILTILALGAANLAYLQKQVAQQQTEIAINQTTIDNSAKEKVQKQLIEIQHAIGLVLLEKAETAVKEKRLNEARLYGLHALNHFASSTKSESLRARGIIVNSQTIPIVFKLPATGQHLDSVTSAAFAPDGKTLASGSHDKTIIIWDLKTGVPVRTLKGHSGWIDNIAYTHSGKV